MLVEKIYLMKRTILLLILSIHTNGVFAENITDKLIVTLINKKLPAVLYKHKDMPWEMGVYSLSVNKTGRASYASTDKQLNLSLPIEVIVNGKIKQNLLGAKIIIDCNSRVTTVGKLNIKPELKTSGSNAKVSIFVPVAETQLNCDGLMIPIKPLLEKLISGNKSTWEYDLESDIYELFQQVGIY